MALYWQHVRALQSLPGGEARHSEQWHEAMGFADGSFSYTGLIQGLPFSYGQFIVTQLVAAALRVNLGMPLIGYQDARAPPELAEVLQRWVEEGFGASHRCAVELGDQPMQAMGLSAAGAASLVQKVFKGKNTDNAARCLQ
eukprot:5042141-Pleurochrysis_carterae.AAC.2